MRRGPLLKQIRQHLLVRLMLFGLFYRFGLAEWSCWLLFRGEEPMLLALPRKNAKDIDGCQSNCADTEEEGVLKNGSCQ